MTYPNLETKTRMLKLFRRDKYYPHRLNDLFDPPNPLYISGNLALLKMPMIAIIGSRQASAHGLRNATIFANQLAQAGALIISGLARGIDGAAHRATLSEPAMHFTAAVCGTGLDIVYPKEHWGLAAKISQQGLLISELDIGIGPKPFHFPRRNRIIAALALGVVVIEAAENSGSLITARIAADLGREVFALPGPAHDPLYAGCHQLIQQGAKLICKPNEVLEELVFHKNRV